ncbi:MAG: tRNA (adenosine(37)-N6)-threonylcarbamoyltransferase complex ATPase subunit type 1 TsaE [Sneathiella sp.]|uniref:tRNA (adenosine(37)-N6)-threonylcarbamoyltransferase complex ATPase subunit type 1 TsaE n=1 Tax=Sneathiella sp. TaxID=1964365 RepID=UPI000C5C98DC|nr:tRNA (adenosine(37)-N6)-threonylcarbamoyltransferase complex ATPase subunit type 1 TsaE [Sneathiella sp.]MAZ03094.1 tRNA (adenosine(37)-N6)-threonylcarbamoyltransferase complex ATPase subunit type 1 TsaE [Sneathiella sp.]
MAQSLIFQSEVKSLAETAVLAEQLSDLLRPGDVIALSGTLGAGKTAFVRALVRALAREEIDVPSPTYNLLLTYDFDDFCLYHYDLYRLEAPEEAFELDIDEAFDSGVSVIEWPDRLGHYLPEDHLRIEITAEDAGNSEARLFSFYGDDPWRRRLGDIAEQQNA